jgi:hypothetical protein
MRGCADLRAADHRSGFNLLERHRRMSSGAVLLCHCKRHK